MARYTGAVCRQCRREGQKLFLKGERCYSDKCALARRNFAPGQHGQARKKSSEYGIQMRAKQKAKRFYGVLEGQFKKAFAEKVLMSQAYIFDDSKTVADFIKDNIAKMGENITVKQFKRIELGVTE